MITYRAVIVSPQFKSLQQSYKESPVGLSQKFCQSLNILIIFPLVVIGLFRLGGVAGCVVGSCIKTMLL